MSQLSITTTQNVNINFNTANPGERVMATLLDGIIITAYYIAVLVIIGQVANVNMDTMDRWSLIAIYSLISLPPAFYSLLFETFMEGQTIGKYVLKIKVIKIDGYQAGFGDYIIRWVFRLLEVIGIMGLVGLIAMSVNKDNRRLGDLAAGTAVISLKNNVTINSTILRDIGNNYQPTYPQVIKLSDNDVRIIKETYETSYQQADFVMIERLQNKIEAVTGIKSASQNATAFVDIVLKDYNYYTQNM